MIYQKLEFILGDTALGIDQLLVGKGQWVYTLDGDRYYLLESKRHYPWLSSSR